MKKLIVTLAVVIAFAAASFAQKYAYVDSDYILENISIKPTAGIILGSGLGSFSEEINILKEVSASRLHRNRYPIYGQPA